MIPRNMSTLGVVMTSNLLRTFFLICSVTVLAMIIPSSSTMVVVEGFQTIRPQSSVHSMALSRAAQPSSSKSSALFGISEWRDIWFDYPGTGDDRRLGTESGPPPKEICILPFPYQEVLLQGETKQLRLYEDRFIELFDYCMEHHEGVVAMGLLAESGIIQTVPICEIEAYNRMEGFGIFVTIRVVGRAQLQQIVQQTPYLKAVCQELTDTLPPNLELPCLVASNIENTILTLSSMEYSLEQANQQKNKEEEDSDEDASSDDDDSSSDDDTEMRRRIQIAKLEDRFYDDLGDDEDEDVIELDRRGRYSQAYNVALQTDTQGYCVVAGGGGNGDGDGSSVYERSPQELTAVSWAAFCTSLLDEEDATYRIQALDSDKLFDRLKLAGHMLKEKKEKLKSRLEQAGIKFRGNNKNGGGGDDGDTSGKD